MFNWKKNLIGGIAAAVMASGFLIVSIPAQAQSIVGNWRTKSGEIARISKCGSAYCIRLRTGKHKGRSIGRMRGSGANYRGTITDPANNKTYSGTATVSGRSMSLSGCVMRVFCRSQKWTKR